MIFKKGFKFDIVEFFKYSQSRIIVTIYANGFALFFVDLLGWKYWQFAIWFIPINFVVSYFITRLAFIDKYKKWIFQ